MQIKLSNIKREFDLHDVDKVSVRRHPTHVAVSAIDYDGNRLDWVLPPVSTPQHPWDRAYVLNDGGTMEVIQHKPEYFTNGE
jgi:hypothetical protein